MKREAVATVVAILVVASLGIGYLSGSSARATKTITSTSTFVSTSILTSQQTITSTTTSTSTETALFIPGAAGTAIGSNGSTGVDLVLAVNATTLEVGQSLNVSVSLFNVLPSTNPMSNSTDWDFQGIPVALWPACYFDLPTEAVVLKGNYTLHGLQSAANVTFSYFCTEGSNVVLATFQPMSSLANLTAEESDNIPYTLGVHRLSLTFATNGYWDLLNNSRQLNEPMIIGGKSPPRAPIATPFVPGVYTVAVADEWGEAAVIHFTVNG